MVHVFQSSRRSAGLSAADVRNRVARQKETERFFADSVDVAFAVTPGPEERTENRSRAHKVKEKHTRSVAFLARKHRNVEARTRGEVVVHRATEVEPSAQISVGERLVGLVDQL